MDYGNFLFLSESHLLSSSSDFTFFLYLAFYFHYLLHYINLFQVINTGKYNDTRELGIEFLMQLQ
jgi:hypothetical protein